MARKHIICKGIGALNAGPHLSTPWDDVWLTWQGKPGRKTYRAAPCLLSSTSLQTDIDHTRDMFKSHPDLTEHWQKDLDYLRTIQKALETQPYVTETSGEFPNTYTRAQSIDRTEAERMLRYMLAFRYGVTGDLKFVWRRAKFYCLSV